MHATPKLHMQDITKAARRPDALRPARALITWGGAMAALLLAIVLVVRHADTIDGAEPPRQIVSGGQMILALSGCPTHDGTAHVLALVLSVDADGRVIEASCARVERPAYLPKRREKVRS